MKKLLFSLLITLIPTLTLTSCFAPSKPSNNPINNDNKKDEDIKPATTFTYNNITYNLIQEDTIDPNNIYYASEVFENDAQQFKSYIPDYKKYFYGYYGNPPKKYWPDLTADFFNYPTLAKLSQFIRNLEHYNVINSDKSSFMLKDKKSDERISAQEYNQLVTKILEILKNQKYLITTINDEEIRDRETPTTKVSDRKKQTLENIRRSMKFVDEEQEKIERAKITYKTELSGFITKSIAEIPFEDSKATAVIHNVTKKIPTGLWKYSRIFDFTGNFKNEYFLQREFFEKSSKFDRSKDHLHSDIFDYAYRNKIKVYAMQKDLWNMLIAYLEFQKTITNPTGVQDENLSLKNNFEKDEILKTLGIFEDKLLEYMKLSQLLGWAVDPQEEKEFNFQLFPGSSNYEDYQTDYRQAYLWAYNQYHEIVQPLKMNLPTLGSPKEKFDKAFDNPELAKYYDLIWANLKLVNNVEKPHLLDTNEAKTKFDKIIAYYSKTFNWKYKN
ncbi:lipoprotein [Mycoplasma feriruminatoris]|uniref:MAG3960 family lipoprotein n=1 Tax=Mycoplasma feriruminatoris TaxID=1179777 RepID=UPI00241DD9E9|nr:lipoprotein [Mycoplasma feriruminatoris]WFQ95708.1 lipoprotein [Mycoplasma feriruminatoris]